MGQPLTIVTIAHPLGLLANFLHFEHHLVEMLVENDWLVLDFYHFLPLWKIMEWVTVGMMTFPTEWENQSHVPNQTWRRPKGPKVYWSWCVSDLQGQRTAKFVLLTAFPELSLQLCSKAPEEALHTLQLLPFPRSFRPKTLKPPSRQPMQHVLFFDTSHGYITMHQMLSICCNIVWCYSEMIRMDSQLWSRKSKATSKG